jgi:hypothetical protein
MEISWPNRNNKNDTTVTIPCSVLLSAPWAKIPSSCLPSSESLDFVWHGRETLVSSGGQLVNHTESGKEWKPNGKILERTTPGRVDLQRKQQQTAPFSSPRNNETLKILVLFFLYQL